MLWLAKSWFYRELIPPEFDVWSTGNMRISIEILWKTSFHYTLKCNVNTRNCIMDMANSDTDLISYGATVQNDHMGSSGYLALHS